MADRTHYGPGLSPGAGRLAAEAMANLLVPALGGRYPVLIFRGMSGTALATRLSDRLAEMGVDHGMVYVRKPEEESHGVRLEYDYDRDKAANHGQVVFVDDFIGVGTTRRKTAEAASAILRCNSVWTLTSGSMWSGYDGGSAELDMETPRHA